MKYQGKLNMKYIKTYEKLDKLDDLKIGNYVICKELDDNVEEKVDSFIENNIGVIVDFRMKNKNMLIDYEDLPIKYYIFVKYENIPDKISNNFDYHKYINNCRIFSKNEIIYSSFNKEELEDILNAKKYNL